MKDAIKIGMIGTGNICRHAHLPAYVKIGDALVTGFYDIDQSASEAAREVYLKLMKEAGRECDAAGVNVYGSAEELLEHVDAVDICTTVRWHAYYADLALKKGVSVMSEKPAARTFIEAEQVARTAAGTSAIYQLNDDNLYIPRYQVLRNIVESGILGEVQSVRIARGSYSVPATRSDWFYDPVESGGGCIMDYGSHAVCSTWFILGYDKVPEEVKAIKISANDRTAYRNGHYTTLEVDDNALFKVRFRNPANGDWADAFIEATWTWPRLASDSSDVRGYVEITGSEGMATGYFDEQDNEFIKVRNPVFGEKLIPVQSVGSEEYSFIGEINNFVHCVREGRPSILNAGVSAGIIKILNCAQLSELKGRVSVPVAEIESFSGGFGSGDIWTVGDRVALALNAPHKLK